MQAGMPSKSFKEKQTAWVITVDMGYGHQRAAYPFADIAHNGIIAMNDYKGLPEDERHAWEQSRKGYELISRIQAKSFVGHFAFELFDRFQEIPRFYPRRDLSRPNLQVHHTYRLIEKQDVGKHLFTKVLAKNQKLPLYCTFFLPAYAAEIYGYEGDIYLQVCDADVSRTWVPRNPKKSRIRYCAPNPRVVERLKLYGVREDNIYETGFPLPEENIDCKMIILKKDIGARIVNLDPENSMRHKFGHIINYHIGKKFVPKRSTHPLTLTFAVGGAGAQADIGAELVKSLRSKIFGGGLRIHLIAGTRPSLRDFYKDLVKEFALKSVFGKHITILYEETKHDYFKKFNKLLRTTDILWTKPSELSFYTALGIPLIMAPSIGSQEDFNRIWLKTIGGGISQDDPRYADEWLFDWIRSGWLARAALNGFSGAPMMGTYEVKRTLFEKGYRPKGFERKSPLAV